MYDIDRSVENPVGNMQCGTTKQKEEHTRRPIESTDRIDGMRQNETGFRVKTRYSTDFGRDCVVLE
jgi:hypothetical protein